MIFYLFFEPFELLLTLSAKVSESRRGEMRRHVPPWLPPATTYNFDTFRHSLRAQKCSQRHRNNNMLLRFYGFETVCHSVPSWMFVFERWMTQNANTTACVLNLDIVFLGCLAWIRRSFLPGQLWCWAMCNSPQTRLFCRSWQATRGGRLSEKCSENGPLC